MGGGGGECSVGTDCLFGKVKSSGDDGVMATQEREWS